MSFRSTATYARAIADNNRKGIAVVTGAKSGIGKALALKLASFPFIDKVLAVSRSIKDQDVSESDKIQAFSADVGTEEGRNKITALVKELCQQGAGKEDERKQLRFLIHNAGTIDPIKSAFDVSPQEMRQAMSINCEAPFFLTAALYPFMVAKEDGIPGRVLHVSSGAAHRPIMGWSVYCITKAAFYQSYKALQLEFQQAHGGRVVVGSFKPGVVDTPMQGVIRDASAAAMPTVSTFQKLKESMQQERAASNRARPPPSDALDTPENVAHFAEFLLLGTSDDEFGMEDHDIRDKNLYTRWIAPEDL